MIRIKRWMFFIITFQFLILVKTLMEDDNNGIKKTSRVAIVGAGIGGAATSFFLSELVSKDEVSVDVYEANNVGGRLSEVEVKGAKFDSGGSVIHSSNLYMDYFRQKLGYRRRKDIDFNKFGLYDGKEFTFVSSSWKIIHLIKLIWRYGLNLHNLPKYVNEFVKKFTRIYDYQNDMVTFNDVESFLEKLNINFPGTLTVTLKDALLKEHFSERLIDELIKAGLMVNYGQGTDVHQFVGTVSMAGGGEGSLLWAVEGGQSLIVKGLLKHSGANLIHSRVEEVHLNLDGTFTLSTDSASEIYDFIVIACPLTDDSLYPIKFNNFPDSISIPGRYHRTVATILHGKLNHTYFGFDNGKDVPDLIANFRGNFFNSVSRISRVNSKGKAIPDVWKIFSQNPLTAEQLQDLFLTMSDVRVVDWLAYPHYSTDKRTDKFILHKNLFYLNAMEWVASAMEMSSISARNIALLIVKSLFPERKLKSIKTDLINEHDEL